MNSFPDRAVQNAFGLLVGLGTGLALDMVFGTILRALAGPLPGTVGAASAGAAVGAVTAVAAVGVVHFIVFVCVFTALRESCCSDALAPPQQAHTRLMTSFLLLTGMMAAQPATMRAYQHVLLNITC
jgi:hypothetical protein